MVNIDSKDINVDEGLVVVSSNESIHKKLDNKKSILDNNKTDEVIDTSTFDNVESYGDSNKLVNNSIKGINHNQINKYKNVKDLLALEDNNVNISMEEIQYEEINNVSSKIQIFKEKLQQFEPSIDTTIDYDDMMYKYH